MPGFPLMAIGAGLGQFAQQYQQQRAAAEREQMLRLTLLNFAQQMQDRQRTRQTEAAQWQADGGLSPVAPLSAAPSVPGSGGVGIPLNDMTAAPRAPLSPGVGGALRSRGDEWLNQNAPFPTRAQPTAGAAGTATFLPTPGPGAPATMDVMAAPTSAMPPPQPGGASPIDRGLPVAEATPATKPDVSSATPDQVVQMMAPDAHLKARKDALVRNIARIPGLDDGQRAQLFVKQWAQIRPEEAEYAREYLRQQGQAHSDVRADIRQDRTDARADARAREQGWEMLKDPTNNDLPYYVRKGHPETAIDMSGQPYKPGGAAKMSAGAGAKSSHNVEVTDAAGKVIFAGSAHQGPQGWISDKDQKPVVVPDEGNIKILGTGGQGRQAAAQIQSMIGSSSELVGEARNLMELPSNAVAGIFQGLQSVPAGQLGDAMKRTLAAKLTPEEQIDVATSFQGVARSLATIEAQGRATGLVGLTGMSQALMPQSGDTLGNRLRKYATLRQIMERNIDAIEANPNASVEQKGLLKRLRDEMAQVIPFTVSEVNKLQHGDKETVAQAARKFGLGSGPGGAGGPNEGDIARAPGKPDLVYRSGQWIPMAQPGVQ